MTAKKYPELSSNSKVALSDPVTGVGKGLSINCVITDRGVGRGRRLLKILFNFDNWNPGAPPVPDF